MEPKPGDLVRVIASNDVLIEVGSYGVIEGREGELKDEYSIVFNPSPLPWWDNGIIDSSGGPVLTVRKDRLQFTGETKDQPFQYFPGMPAAHTAKVKVRKLNVFSIDLTH